MTAENVMSLIAIILGSNWLGQILIELYKSKTKKKTPAEIILKSLSRSHLLQSADKYHELGYIPAEEFDDIMEEYRAYDALDGNGRVKREFGEGGALKSLPIR